MFRITSYGLDFYTTEFPIVKYQWFFEWTRGALFTVVKLLRNVWAYSLLLARIMTREWRTINRCAAKFRENVFIWKPFTSINVYRTRNIVCFSPIPVDGLYSVFCVWCMQWVYVKELDFNAIKSRRKKCWILRKKSFKIEGKHNPAKEIQTACINKSTVAPGCIHYTINEHCTYL